MPAERRVRARQPRLYSGGSRQPALTALRAAAVGAARMPRPRAGADVQVSDEVVVGGGAVAVDIDVRAHALCDDRQVH